MLVWLTGQNEILGLKQVFAFLVVVFVIFFSFPMFVCDCVLYCETIENNVRQCSMKTTNEKSK